MSHILDRPAWSALTSVHANLAEGNNQALRYPPSIVPFAAAIDVRPKSLTALSNLLAEGETLAIFEAGPLTIPEELTVVVESKGVQMVAQQPYERISDSRIAPLTEADAADMLELALLTKPGPFTLRAQALGTFWGVKVDGRLVAMAGQRMRQPGFAELSGLCTHPDFQGQGLGKLLFRYVAGEISARGDTVYLHAYASNTHAIALYETLGFQLRTEMAIAFLTRPSAEQAQQQ